MQPCTACRSGGAPLASNAGLCPVCLLRLGLTPEPAEPSTSSDGQARWLAPIGRGPDGIVYLASDPDDPRALVTVKVVDAPVVVSRFIEAVHETMARLRTASLPRQGRLLGAERLADGRACVRAVYAPGQPLDGFVRLGAPVRAAVQALAQLCTVVSEVHRQAVVHGSIKPENVIVVTGWPRSSIALLDVGVRPALACSITEVSRPRGAHHRQEDVADLGRLVGRVLSLYPGTPECADLLNRLHCRRTESATDLLDELHVLETSLATHAQQG